MRPSGTLSPVTSRWEGEEGVRGEVGEVRWRDVRDEI